MADLAHTDQGLQLHRWLLGMAVVTIPVLGWVYHVVAPHEFDPMSHRLAFSALGLGLIVGSGHDGWVARHLEGLSAAAIFLFTGWFLWITTLAGFSVPRIMGLTTILSACAVMLRDPRINTAYGAMVVAGCALGLRLGPPTTVATGMLFAVVATIASFSAVSSYLRARADERTRTARARLAEAHAELERRVDERTAELRREVLERQLAEDRAAAANQAKSRFLTTMSHELRTPLTAIVGYSQILREEAEDPSVADDLDRVLAAAGQLGAMIDDVLDIVRIESGRIELTRTRVDVRALLEEVADTIGPIARRHGDRVSVEVDPPDISLWADRTRLVQVLTNLAENAAAFTDHGDITLSARTAPGEVLLEVRDTGIGIAEDALPTLFQKFSQVDGSTTRRHDGSGLGLAIARELVELHAGRMEVESEVGVGSTFRVRLPSTTSPAEARDPDRQG